MPPLRYVGKFKFVLPLASLTHGEDTTRLIGRTLQGSEEGHYKAHREDATRLRGRTLQGSEGGHYKAQRRFLPMSLVVSSL